MDSRRGPATHGACGLRSRYPSWFKALARLQQLRLGMGAMASHWADQQGLASGGDRTAATRVLLRCPCGFRLAPVRMQPLTNPRS